MKQSEPASFDLESVYDAEIAPLMMQIIEICKRHKMPMLATFLYRHSDSTGDGDDHYCTTALDNGDGWQPDEIKKSMRIIKDGTAQCLAFAITSKQSEKP